VVQLIAAMACDFGRSLVFSLERIRPVESSRNKKESDLVYCVVSLKHSRLVRNFVSIHIFRNGREEIRRKEKEVAIRFLNSTQLQPKMYPSVPTYLFGDVLKLNVGDRVTIDYDTAEGKRVEGHVSMKNRFGVLVVPYQNPNSIRERAGNLLGWTFVRYNQMESMKVLEKTPARGSNIAAAVS
jgi:hypothetical protein